MGATVAELTERLTAAEEAHWIALYKQEPWGDQRADVRAAQIAQILYNTNAPRGKARKLNDFMLFSKKEEQKGDSAATIRKNFERLIARQKR